METWSSEKQELDKNEVGMFVLVCLWLPFGFVWLSVEISQFRFTEQK